MRILTFAQRLFKPSARWLGAPLLALSILACSVGGSPTDSAVRAGGADATSAPAETTDSASIAAQPGQSIDASDAVADCFNGFREAEDCAGLDLARLQIGLPALAPDLTADPVMQGRLSFVITFAQDVSRVEEFGLCLYFDIDRAGSTGLDQTDMPGLDLLICGDMPQGSFWTKDWSTGNYDAPAVRDEARVAARVRGRLVAIAVPPALLADSPGTAPDGFVLYVGTARSITALDYFNGGLPLHVPQAFAIPDEVVAQVR